MDRKLFDKKVEGLPHFVAKSCLFTNSELARDGLSEREAGDQGVPYRLAKISMAAALRTRTLLERRDFMKVPIYAESSKVLGFIAIRLSARELLPASYAIRNDSWAPFHGAIIVPPR